MNALARRDAPRASIPAVRLAAAGVTCEVRCTAVDRRARVARYELAIDNATPSAVACRIVGVSHDERVVRELGGAGVSGDGCGHSSVSVPLRALRRSRLEVELVGDDLHLTAAAPPAVRHADATHRRPRGLLVGLCCCAAGVLAAVGALAAPRAPAFPPPVAAASPAPTIIGRVHARRLRERVVPGAPQIASFGARRDDYEGRGAILASYAANAERGTLRVLDESGHIVASAPFSKGGLTRMTLPAALPAQTLRTELDVERGGVRTLSWLEIPAAPNASPSPSSSPSPAPSAAANVADENGGTTPSPVEVTGSVVPGHDFTVAVRRAVPHLRLTVQDAFGSVVEELPVADGTSAVSLHAPADAAHAKYYVVATFARGDTDEVAIRSLHISPV